MESPHIVQLLVSCHVEKDIPNVSMFQIFACLCSTSIIISTHVEMVDIWRIARTWNVSDLSNVPPLTVSHGLLFVMEKWTVLHLMMKCV